MKTILFHLQTEYQLLAVLSIIQTYYKDNSYKIIINIFKTKNSSRFNFEFYWGLVPNLRVNFYSINTNEGVVQEDFERLLEDIRSESVDIFIPSNRLFFINFYFIKYFDKLNIPIFLAPDGLAAYTVTKRFTPRWSFQESYYLHKFLFAHRIFVFYLYWPTLFYGRLKEIRSLFIEFVDGFDNLFSKKIIPFNLMNKKAEVNLISEVFGFKIERKGLENVFFYCNQPFGDEKIYAFEIEFLKWVKKNYRNRKLIVKLHPSSSIKQVKKIENLGCQLLRDTFPAELYISNLKDSIVASFWSTANLINNRSCRIVWLYPLLISEGIMSKNVKFTNPTKHIEEIKTLVELKNER